MQFCASGCWCRRSDPGADYTTRCARDVVLGPLSTEVRGCPVSWARQDSNLQPKDYESVSLQIGYLEERRQSAVNQVFHCSQFVTSLHGFSVNRVLSAS